MRDVLACPRCRRPFDPNQETCGCGARWPRVDGVLLMADEVGDTAAFYEIDESSRYGRSTPPEREGRIVRDFLKRVPVNDTVVELGSGQCLFAGWHPRLVLCDFSAHALRSYGSGARIQLDAQRLPFRDGSIDALFSLATLEHIPSPERALAEIERCLKPGGKALLFPAWLVPPWASRNLAGRDFAELPWGERCRKMLIPIRRRPAVRFLTVLPSRLRREMQLARGGPLPFSYRRLQPNVTEYLTSDSDAYTSMDPHSCIAYFLSRGYDVVGARAFWARLLYRYEPVEIHKP